MGFCTAIHAKGTQLPMIGAMHELCLIGLQVVAISWSQTAAEDFKQGTDQVTPVHGSTRNGVAWML